MQPQPEDAHRHYAEAFKDAQVVDAYRYRPPYPDEVFDILISLITDELRTVLDVGAGSGDIARRLVEAVERIDAVDFSQNMIERGKSLPHGNHPRLHWIYGKVEDVPLLPSYALITAGSSIHWTDWKIAFPRFHDMLTPHGYLALIYRRTLSTPWEAELRELRTQFAAWGGPRGRDTIKELEVSGFFQKHGEKETVPVPFVQSIDDFIEGLHSRSAFTRELMGQQRASEFDQQVRGLLSQYAADGILSMQVVATVAWGKPERGTTGA